MVLCKKCGVDNPLGRVFCGGCGARLELDRINTSTPLKSNKPNWFRVHGIELTAGLGIAILAVAALAFWPQSEPIGGRPSAGGASRLTGPLRAMANLRTGQSIGKYFMQADINGLLSPERVKEMGIDALSVDIFDGSFNVRMVRTLPALSLGSIRLQPKLSYDYVCIPVGSVIHVKQVVAGHLPLVGPLRSGAIRRIYRLLAAQKEWSAFENTTEIRAEKGKIWVKVAK